MPRIGRVMLANYPHHIVQRGHNRQVVFAEARDYVRYLDTLAEFKAVFDIKVYAYCLMTNHVHLLLAPGEEIAAVGRLMKRLAGRQTRYHNGLEGRTGTLWESRYKSSPVDNDSYLLACSRYIELNPVRARMVAVPEAYRWSSCSHHLGDARCHWLDDDPCYRALGDDEAQRQARYRQFLLESIPPGEWALIREAVQRGQLTGTSRFVDQVEDILGRRIERRSPGRPVRARNETEFK
ncbi:MAG: transposase [Gammaproteobacteria bacterium]|nr:transposase [Gammaproteobacteria bacterium]